MPSTPLRRSRLPRQLSVVAAVTLALLASLLTPIAAQAAPVTLSGTVVGPTGTAMPGLVVSVVRVPSGTVAATATTSATGAYSVAGLAAGTYTLSFPATATTFAQYLGSAQTLAEARPLTLEDGGGNVALVRVALAPSGAITGDVKTTARVPLRSFTVRAYTEVDGAWTVAATTTTSATGVYLLRGLAPGNYRIEATGGAGSAYTPLYSGYSASLQTASDVGVVAGATSSAYFRMGLAGRITGKVTGDVGGSEPVPGTRVIPFRYIGEIGLYSGIEELRSLAQTTSATGAFTLTGLPPGRYVLRLEPPITAPLPASGTVYGSVFHGGATDMGDAVAIDVTSGGTVIDRNTVLRAGGTVSGIISDGGGTPLPNVRVAMAWSGEDPFDGLHTPRSTLTDASGRYTFTSVPVGSYLIFVGSFTDMDPSDGVSEDTSWERDWVAFGSMSVGGQQLTKDGTADPRIAVEPIADFPAISNGSGMWEPGAPLTVSLGTWSSTGSAFSLDAQWFRDGVPITGATSSNYTVRPGDVGHTITAVVSRNDKSLGLGEYETAPTPEIQLGTLNVYSGIAQLAGTPEVGQLLTVVPAAWEAPGIEPSWIDPGIAWTYVWQRSPDNSTWTTIPGETGPTHRVTPLDATAGRFLRVLMSGTRDGYAPVIDVPTLSAFVDDGSISAVAAPKVTRVGTTLRVSTGTWTPTPTSYDYLWQVHDQSGAVVESLTTPTISTTGRTGRYITVQVTPLRDSYFSTGVVLTAQVGAALTAPESLATTGSATVGGIVTAPTLTFTPTETVRTYQWQYLSSRGWRSITGATSASYTIDPTLLGRYLRVVVVASRTGYTSATKVSALTAKVGLGVPLVSTTLVTSGTPAVNSTVQVDTSTWTPAATSLSYQWRQATSMGGPWTSIAGATKAAYTIPVSLGGKFLSVLITASRPGHPSASIAADLGEIIGGTLVNTVAPKVSPVPGQPGTFTVSSNGTWSPAATGFDYAWFSYAADGTRSNVAYDTGPTSDTTSTSLYNPVDVRVVATKGGYTNGEIYVPAKDGTFLAITPPGIEVGTGAVVDGTLTAVDPVLSNPPDVHSHSLQWQVKSTTGAWTSIAGATQSTFTPVGASWIGKEVRLQVRTTATRYTPLVSESDPVTIGAGVLLEPGIGSNAPSFSGPAQINQTITVSPGRWNVNGATFTYQWQESVGGGAFVSIPGATKASYLVPISKHGSELRVVITAARSGHPNGTTNFAVPAPVGDGVIPAGAAPVVTKSGTVLTVTPGTWGVAGTTPSYLWERIDRNTGLGVTVSTTSTYTLTFADIDQFVRVTVSAAKPLYTTASRQVVAQLGSGIQPTNATFVAGVRNPGSILSVSLPDWDVNSPSVAVQWLRDGVVIPGATSTLYTQTTGDIGKTISIRLTATQVGYPSSVVTVSGPPTVSTVTIFDLTPPSTTVPAGGARVGELLTAKPGTWSQTGVTLTYQWMSGGIAIPGATATTYRLAASDVDEQVWVVVTASKTGFRPVSARSEARSVEAGVAPVLTAPTTFTTAGIVRNTTTGLLTSAALTWSLPVTVTYQWEFRDEMMISFAPIPGADAATYQPPASPTNVRLVVTATRPGHPTTVVISNTVAIP